MKKFLKYVLTLMVFAFSLSAPAQVAVADQGTAPGQVKKPLVIESVWFSSGDLGWTVVHWTTNRPSEGQVSAEDYILLDNTSGKNHSVELLLVSGTQLEIRAWAGTEVATVTVTSP